MPVQDRTQARDELFTRLKNGLDAADLDELPVIYEDAPKDRPAGDVSEGIPSGATWLYVLAHHRTGGQASLGTVNGKRRFLQTGTLEVMVHTPAGDGLRRSDTIVEAILDIFRSGGQTPGGIQFRMPRSEEIGNTGTWYVVQALVDFEYDVIR